MAKVSKYISNLHDLCCHFGVEGEPESLNRAVYKETECGASISVRRKDDGTWLHNGEKKWATLTEIDAFTIQTIIEGSDITVDSPAFVLPVTHISVNKWVEEMEEAADRLWKEANEEQSYTYRIECGNSNTGAVGAVAYVEAESPAEAMEKLLAALPDEGIEEKVTQDVTVRVYFGQNKWSKPEEWQ